MNLDELGKRVRAIEDLEEVKKLHRDYISCLDNLEFKKALDFFTEDAEVEVRFSGVMKGKVNFSRIYLETLAQRKERHDGHLVGQPVITIDGDTARGHWIVYIFFSEPTIDWVQGRNDCEYVRENGTWKFSLLHWNNTFCTPFEDGWLNMPLMGWMPMPDADALPTAFHPYPSGYHVPYHYKHPVTGK